MSAVVETQLSPPRLWRKHTVSLSAATYSTERRQKILRQLPVFNLRLFHTSTPDGLWCDDNRPFGSAL